MRHSTASPLLAERFERAVLITILIVVGGLAGLASFTHVHDWTMENGPVGTPDWFGWANAAISELIPIAALLTVRQRRRIGDTAAYPTLLLIGAALLSLAAQLAVAKPGISGWLLSAVPALAFMGLSKLVLSGNVTTAEPKHTSVSGAAHARMSPSPEPAVDLIAVADLAPVEPVADVPVASTAGAATPLVRRRPTAVTAAPKVQAAAAKMPDATPAQIAAKAGVSESTARRYMPRPGVSMTSPTTDLSGNMAHHQRA